MFVGRDGALLRRSNFRRAALEARAGPRGTELRVALPRPSTHSCRLLHRTGDARVSHLVRLGHASIKTTLDLYGHLLPEEDDAFRDGLDALYREAKARPRVVRALYDGESAVLEMPTAGGESGI
jgi:integrase